MIIKLPGSNCTRNAATKSWTDKSLWWLCRVSREGWRSGWSLPEIYQQRCLLFIKRVGSVGVCEVTGSRVNWGVGLGLEIPCTYKFYGRQAYFDRVQTLILSAADGHTTIATDTRLAYYLDGLNTDHTYRIVIVYTRALLGPGSNGRYIHVRNNVQRVHGGCKGLHRPPCQIKTSCSQKTIKRCCCSTA